VGTGTVAFGKRKKVKTGKNKKHYEINRTGRREKNGKEKRKQNGNI